MLKDQESGNFKVEEKVEEADATGGKKKKNKKKKNKEDAQAENTTQQVNSEVQEELGDLLNNINLN